MAKKEAVDEAVKFVDKINEVIIFPLITLLTAIAFLIFLWGCAQYFMNATNDTARQEGVKHITFGIIGLVIMISAFAILSLFSKTVGLGDELNCANDPSVVGCDTVFSL